MHASTPLFTTSMEKRLNHRTSSLTSRSPHKSSNSFSPADSMLESLSPLVAEMSRRGILYREAVQEFKKKFLNSALRENDDNRSRAARRLGMHRNTIHGLIRQLKIDSLPVRATHKRPSQPAQIKSRPRRSLV